MLIEPEPGREKRQHHRIPYREPLEYRLNEFDVLSGTLAGDLSQGGLRFYSNTFIPLKSTVFVNMFQGEKNPMLTIKGTVVWVREFPESERFQVGVQFDVSDPDTVKNIHRIVQLRHLQQSQE